MRAVAVAFLAAIAAMPAFADGFVPVRERSSFLQLIEGRELRLPLYGIRLKVKPNGLIEGRALGWGVSGKWDWKDGYFCRSLDWSGYQIPFNCQLVEARGDETVRFTVDRGQGDSAEFRLR